MDALDKAIKHQGGVTLLAKALGVGQPVVSNWRRRKTIIPAEHCVSMERLTHGEVTRKDLRPNDWAKVWPELAEREGLVVA